MNAVTILVITIVSTVCLISLAAGYIARCQEEAEDKWWRDRNTLFPPEDNRRD